jgi:TPR repeat protein
VLVLLLALAASARADLESAVDAYGRGDFAAAIEALEPLAEGDAVEAQYYLGLSYNFRAQGDDLARAAAWLRRAARQGHGESQHSLALLYLDGRGVKRSRGEALYWFRRAVVNGVPEAGYFLPQGGGGQ